MILLLHNRYRTLGGEERVVDELARLIPQQLGEEVTRFESSSADISAAQAAVGLVRGGLNPDALAAEIRRTGARVVHAHNLLPAYGWRALAAARAAGARTVLTMHQYRLVCAAGTCLDSAGEDCTRCHGRDTRPGVRLNCRGGSRAEASLYAASLARWSARTVEEADVLTVPSAFTLERLRELGAPIDGRSVEVLPNPVFEAAEKADPPSGSYAICSARLAHDKGVDLAIEACALAGRPLVITGHGPDREKLERLAATLGADVRFAGRVSEQELARLRAGAALAVVPSRFAETFGLSAAEAMAAALPVVGFNVGALCDLLADGQLADPGSVDQLASLIALYWGDRELGLGNAGKISVIASPEVVARRLASLYGQ
ncbi:MAG: glycosyltransferase [Actinobacteria bacterium]|uniref:Unannotated protein n=1 Tax=freshwater metagenome TaxID=449393 RepID=A0A6J5ZBM1_9ZZZZ|nr:glycosyltransferase [Actinomycetota bacterium]